MKLKQMKLGWSSIYSTLHKYFIKFICKTIWTSGNSSLVVLYKLTIYIKVTGAYAIRVSVDVKRIKSSNEGEKSMFSLEDDT